MRAADDELLSGPAEEAMLAFEKRACLVGMNIPEHPWFYPLKILWLDC